MSRAPLFSLALVAAGCATAPRPQPLPDVAPVVAATGTCTVVGPAPADLHAAFLQRGSSLPIAGGLLLSCTCGPRPEPRALAGDTEARELSGSTEERELAGKAEQRELAGSTEDRALAGATEVRDLAGGTEQRGLAGGTEQRALAGKTEERALAGGVEDRELAGATEQRALAGASEERALAGGTGALTCHVIPACDGYLVMGHGALQYYDGQQLVTAIGRCVR